MSEPLLLSNKLTHLLTQDIPQFLLSGFTAPSIVWTKKHFEAVVWIFVLFGDDITDVVNIKYNLISCYPIKREVSSILYSKKRLLLLPSSSLKFRNSITIYQKILKNYESAYSLRI